MKITKSILFVFLALSICGLAHAEPAQSTRAKIFGPANVLGKAFEDFSHFTVKALSDVANGTVGTAKGLYGAFSGQDLNEK